MAVSVLVHVAVRVFASVVMGMIVLRRGWRGVVMAWHAVDWKP
jgi:hypothetical protein